MWTEALRAKFEDGKPFGHAEFDNLLGKWGATTEQPVSFLPEEMLAAYPDAKVILVERDVERWYKSFSEVVINGYASPFVPLGTMIDRTYLGQMRAQMDLIIKHYFHVQENHTRFGLFNNPEFFNKWRENARSTYLAHNDRIKRITPKDRLLVYRLDQGWEPLCQHLGKPIPDVPFPRVNETLAMQEKINLYIAESYKRSFMNSARRSIPMLAILLIGFAWYFLA